MPGSLHRVWYMVDLLRDVCSIIRWTREIGDRRANKLSNTRGKLTQDELVNM